MKGKDINSLRGYLRSREVREGALTLEDNSVLTLPSKPTNRQNILMLGM